MLVCLPFAGGNVYSYRPFEREMAPAVRMMPLEPPGRGRRLREPRLATVEEMARDMVAQLRPTLSSPYALFGHSMGALVAFLTARLLAEEGLPLPRHLFLSGKGPPTRTSREAAWHTLPLEEFRIRLMELGGCAPAIIQDRELWNYVAPIIRDDMRAVAAYAHRPAPPLPVPMTVLLGDRESTTPEEGREWQEQTSAGCRVQRYPGGHFFLFDHCSAICALLHETLIRP